MVNFGPPLAVSGRFHLLLSVPIGIAAIPLS